ncbi:MAG: hypothetical protein H7Y03_04040 [Chitinophagaceae bacterium]|nr:hypothetical protein [Chitinophagaceae bacterium]
MNLDEIKSVWKEYDLRLQMTQKINEKIIVSMIAERSTSRFVKARRNYIAGMTWMVICLLLGCAVLLGNPFDYYLTAQYIPIAIYCFCIAIFTGAMAHTYICLKKISISHNTLDISLKKIIGIYEKPKKFLKYALIVFLFTQVFLFPLSFLPKGIEKFGLWLALSERLIPISISFLMLYTANKLGAFKERNAENFKADLNELNELRAVAAELKEN